MALPTGWGRTCSLTIADAMSPAAFSDFTVVLDRACFPDEVFSPTSPNAAASDGGDLRFSSDSSGATQIAASVKGWVRDSSDGAGDGRCKIHVIVPSLAGAADTVIYAWWSNGSASLLADSDTYGANNAFDADHLEVHAWTEDDTDTAPQFVDLTTNARHGTAYEDTTAGANAELAAGANGLDFLNTPDESGDATPVGLVRIGAMPAITAGVILVDATPDETNVSSRLFAYSGFSGSHRLYWGLENNGVTTQLGGGSAAIRGSTLSPSTRTQIALRWASGSAQNYVDGASFGSSYTYTGTPGGSSDSDALACWGSYSYQVHQQFPYDGRLHYSRILTADKGANWIIATQNNMGSPSTYITAGTPTDVGAGTGDIVVTPSAVSAIAGRANPGVVLGSLALAPTQANAVAGRSGPGVVLGDVSFTASAAKAVAGRANPSYMAGSLVVTPDPALAFGSEAGPTVASSGLIVTPGGAVAIAGSADPSVLLGSTSLTPSSASGIASRAGPDVVLASVALTPAAANAIAGAVDPNVLVGFGPVTPSPALSVAGAAGPTVQLGDVVVTAAAAAAVGRTFYRRPSEIDTDVLYAPLQEIIIPEVPWPWNR